MNISPCTSADLQDWATMRAELWPEDDARGHRDDAEPALCDPMLLNLIVRDAEGAALGFAEASLRHGYVEGCETSPVAYLEGIYVVPAHRRRGIAAALVARVARWGRARGCAEFASDALLEDGASHAFHAAAGFEEAARIVCFRKAL